MNLFLVALDVPEDSGPRLVRALSDAAAAWPQLSPETLWWQAGPGYVAGCVSHRPEAVGPRRYLHHSDGVTTFYDGLPVCEELGTAVQDAAVLARRWDRLPGAVEGSLAAVRLDQHRGTAELRVDGFGMAQVFVLRQDGAEYWSNSSRLLESLTDDPVGVDLTSAALVVSMGWVLGDRTLHPRVRVLQPDERRVWRAGRGVTGRVDPSGNVVVGRLLERSQRPRSPGGRPRADVGATAARLSSLVGSLGRAHGPLQSALTAGKDSRLVVALARHAGVPARYYTFGRPGDTDLDVARAVSQRFGLVHEVRPAYDLEVARTWPGSSHRHLLQTDGLVSLKHLAARQDADPAHVGVVMHGIGGEIARTPMATPPLALGIDGWPRVVARLLPKGRPLDTAAGLDAATTAVREELEQGLSYGLSSYDVLEHMLATHRIRRWAYANVRMDRPVADTFSPFCTRAFVDYAYAHRRPRRYAETPHLQLTRALDPQLLEVPYDTPWRSQRFAAAPVRELVQRRVVHRVLQRDRGPAKALPWRLALRGAWFDVVRQQVRQECLDAASSPLWHVVDRAAFEHLTDARTDPDARTRQVDHLLDVVTLFRRERVWRAEERQALPGSTVPHG